jgi:aryl-alcohol dehydrogenase-like predicted oxidoreductase
MKNNYCFGTANFVRGYGILKGKGFSQRKIKEIFNFLRKNNIKYIDTAINYKGVERKLGKLKLNYFKVYTKIPKLPKNIININQWLNRKINTSLKRTNLECYEAVFLHEPEDLLKKNKRELYQSLIRLKKKGKIKKIGLSLYSLKIIPKIIKDFKIDIIQVPFNVFDKRILKIIKRLKKRKIEVNVRSIFLQGILLKDYNKLPNYFKHWRNRFIKFENWCIKHKISKVEACLNTVLENNLFDKVIIGAKNLEQLNEIFSIINKKPRRIYPKNFHITDKRLIDPRLWRQ